MEEWKEYKLGDVCIMKNGRKRPIDEGEYPVYGGNGIMGYSNQYNTEDTIIVGRVGAYCGNVFLSKNKCWVSDNAISVVAKNQVHTDFLYYLMLTLDLHNQHIGAAQPLMTQDIIGRFEVKIPSLSTQLHIADILISLDDKIEVNRKINSNLEEQAKALFKSWFIDFEPFKDGKFIDSELGKIPEGWKVVTIGEVTDNIKEKVCDRDSIKVLSPVTSGHLVLSEEYFSKQVFSSSIAKYIVVKHNDFAYNPARINIGSIGMNEFEFDGCVSPVYVVFRCQSGYEYFFDLYRRTSYFIEEVKKRAIGGVRQTLSYKDLSLIQLIYPPKKVVDAFNFIYISFIHEIHSNDVSNKKLEAIRDALLPKLMSGEIDVS